MSAARFKSKDDYFSKRSNLTRQMIERKPRKKQKKAVDTSLPFSLVIDVFCRTVDIFDLEGKGRFEVPDYPLEEAVEQHLAGKETVRVNPRSHSGENTWNVVRFVRSEQMDHPFTKARQFADELRSCGIQSAIEVTEGGKGDYHLWIFHEEPVAGSAFTDALEVFGHKLFGISLEMAPSIKGEVYVPLPLQGESLLFQRRVFVNTVGKMIKDQSSFLQSIERNSQTVVEAFVAKMSAEKPKIPVDETGLFPEREKIKPEVTVPSPGTRSKKISIRASDTVTKTTVAPEEHKISVEKSVLEEKKTDVFKIGLSRVLIFTVHGNEYCIDADSVVSLLSPSEITTIPASTESVIGTARIHGGSAAVLDAGMLLEGRKIETSIKARILLIEGRSGCTGLLVDGVCEYQNVVSIHKKPIPEKTGDSSFISCSAKIAGHEKAVPCIDHEKITDSAEKDSTFQSHLKIPKNNRFVIFSIDDVICGISADSVMEIMASGNVRGMLRDEKNLSGVIKHGKTFIPVVDLREKLNIHIEKSALEQQHGRFLVLKCKDSLFGVKVDRVEGFLTLSPDSIDQAPLSLAEKTPVSAFARDKGFESDIMIIDPESFMEIHA